MNTKETFEMAPDSKPQSKNPVEKCVICKKVTPYHRNDHIKDRQYYVEGVGQLCKQCYVSTVVEE